MENRTPNDRNCNSCNFLLRCTSYRYSSGNYHFGLQYRSEKLPFIDFQENMFRQDLLTFTRVMIKYQYLCNIS